MIRHTALRAELAEWRAGKRRVVWRVRWGTNGLTHGPADFPHKRQAVEWAKTWCLGKVAYYRVTVGPAKPKGAE